MSLIVISGSPRKRVEPLRWIGRSIGSGSESRSLTIQRPRVYFRGIVSRPWLDGHPAIRRVS